MAIEMTAGLVEALSAQMAWCMPSGDWDEVFIEQEGRGIRFEEVTLTLVHAQPELPLEGERADRVWHEMRWLASRHNGKVDRSAGDSSLTLFKNPRSALRMALAIQQLTDSTVQFRTGIHTADCTIAFFEAGGQRWSVVVGPERGRSAEMAWSAVAGTIALSAASYRQLGDDLDVELRGALVSQEFDGAEQLVQATVILPPRATAFQSSFAGLGLT